MTNLISWWEKEFTTEEKKYILEKYKPMGRLPLLEDLQIIKPSETCSFLSNLSSWFSTKKDAALQGKILQQAINYSPQSRQTLDIHFHYQILIKFYYQQRNLDENNYKMAIQYCLKQISISSQAKKEFLESKGFTVLPRHIGFEQLSIIYEKQNEISNAITLCLNAQKEGWNGDWDKRIERLKQKTYKS